MADGYEFHSPPDRIPNSASLVSRTRGGDSRSDEAMSDEDFEGSFSAAVSDATDYCDSYLSPARAVAMKYYRGEPLGNEEEGRSQIVMSEVRDAVLGVVPSLLRTFVGGDHAVEFVPQNAQSVEIAKQQTDYVSYVVMNDNPGFLVIHSLIKDALIGKLGVVKWRWSEDMQVTETAFTGLFPEQIEILAQDPSSEIVELVETTEQKDSRYAPPPQVEPGQGQPGQGQPGQGQPGQGQPGQGQPGQGQPGQGQPGLPTPPVQKTFDVRIRRRIPERRCIVEALPPEEYLFNRDARDTNDPRGYTFQAHRSLKTVSEIVAMGYDRDEVEEHSGDSSFTSNYEQNVRNPANNGLMGYSSSPDESQNRVMFYEAYQRIDRDGDGIAEVHKIHALGGSYHILHSEVVEDAPFAVFTPDPEPHTVVGSSVADQTMDIQRIKSNVVRSTLDSLAQSIHPRTAVMESQVNMDDMMNTEMGAMIRITGNNPGAIQELVKPFNGQAVMPVLAYLDQIKSKRTGLTDAAQGMSPELLQSSTKDAVSATITGSQERIEMYARVLAETAMRRLYRGVAKTLRENQDAPRIVKLRGQFVAVDPRGWVGELECVPNVVMGRGTDQQRMQFLMTILAQQKEIMGQLGPVNPICGVDRVTATINEIITLAGFKDPSKYIGVATPEFMQQLQQHAAQPPPNPNLILAQAEQQKVQGDIAFKTAKLQQEQYEAVMTNERETLKILLDAQARLEQTDAQFGINPASQPLIDSLLNHEREMARVQNEYMASLHSNQTAAQGQIGAAAMKQLAPPQGPQQ
jgi:hypothetical protein